MRTSHRLVVALAALLAVASVSAQDLAPARELQLTGHLPRDPLVAWSADIGSGAEVYDRLLGFARKVVPAAEKAGFEQSVADLDAKLGIRLRDDLLVELGPEMAVAVDLPPLDLAAGAVMAGSPGGLTSVLDKVGFWVQVRDRAKVDRALRAMAEHAGLTVSEDNGLVRLRVPQEKSEAAGSSGPAFELFYAVDRGVLAVGFTPERVRAMTVAGSAGERLGDGADFQRVSSHLDRGARSLLYVNLPRLQDALRSSQMVQGALAGNEEARPFAQLLLDPALAPTGYGATTVAVDGGSRQVSFGPDWTSGGVAAVGMVAAVAVPNLLSATERGRQKRTMADIRSLATAVEAYAVDNSRYPARQGWVDVGTLESDLSPDYIVAVPTTDGWGHPLRYWSDGQRYRIVSPGKDGQISADWSGQVEPQGTASYDADLVYGDGSFLVYPQGTE